MGMSKHILFSRENIFALLDIGIPLGKLEDCYNWAFGHKWKENDFNSVTCWRKQHPDILIPSNIQYKYVIVIIGYEYLKFLNKEQNA